ncbi:Hypp9590 [Branchiostoma lanceolatum]|uniref:Hypp9590 protein n=1 Tax=Branchiostoma lanceolatum TaxID=7740 RepID=A0A8S4MNL8_BRALA|nr:Hypp9590 [Branchiostoma lanceolatum]
MFAAMRTLRFSGGTALTVCSPDGEVLAKPLDQAKVISNYFEGLFNIDATPVPSLTAEPLRNPVTASEVARAASRLKNGRSFGADGVPNELLKYCCSKSDDPMCTTAARIINAVFSKGEVMSALGQGILIPLQKPGKPRGPCSSLRPIVLLNGLRKLFSLIVLERCKPQVNLYLPRSQSAYRQGHSTADIVFTKRILADLVMTRMWDVHILGIDLSRAFDTVDRARLLSLLKDVVNDDDTVRMIQALLTDTTLAVRVRGEVAPQFQATVGSPQGDSLSPQLFNVYYEAALRDLRRSSPPIPAEDKRLKLAAETQYADDLDFISTSSHHLEKIHEEAMKVLPEWKLHANAGKTERVHICHEKDREEEEWRRKKSVGSRLGISDDIEERIQLANVAMRKMWSMWGTQHISLELKLKLFQVYVIPVILYNAGTWGLTEQLAYKIDSWHRKQLRLLTGHIYPNCISNVKLYNK